jgi:heterocycloanthracin/sonorensin family bacteriocin
MDDFQKQLQELNVANFEAGQMIPHDAQSQYNMDQARQCGHSCFHNCFHNCFHHCFHNCFHHCGRCGHCARCF